jgi:hypothetical protein
LIGGNIFVDEEAGLLFSSYDSDIPGIAVFDLNNDSLRFNLIELNVRPRTVHKSQGGQYFMIGQDLESDELSIWTFDWDQQKIVAANQEAVQMNQANPLPQLEFDLANCRCW